MKLYYKLTTQDMKTRAGYKNEHQWQIGIKYEINKILQNQGFPLCTEAWFHIYPHPLLAILLNSIHANIKNPRLFKCVCSGLHKSDNGLKEGFTKIKLTSEMQVSDITLNQKVAFGILCAKKVYFEKKWRKWANGWLKNIDRSYAAANAATDAVNSTYKAYVAANVAAGAAFNSAYAAAYAATNAATNAAADAVNAAADAVNAAVYATDVAGNIIKIDLIKIAKQAMKY